MQSALTNILQYIKIQLKISYIMNLEDTNKIKQNNTTHIKQQHQQYINQQKTIRQTQTIDKINPRQPNTNFNNKMEQIIIFDIDDDKNIKQCIQDQGNQQQQLTIKQNNQQYTQHTDSKNNVCDNQQVQNKQNSDSKSRSNNSLSIFIQDSQIIPTVFLQPSPKGQKSISIKIPMYRTTTFMKLQTQIFILDITKPGISIDYQIQRRYSDFVQFYQALFYNHPGYILAPFPDKGLESFIKIKLGLGTQQPGQRCQLIQKRMLELQKFINFITHHRQLSNSQQLANFITQNPTVYEQGKKRLQKYLNQNKTLQKSSQIKNIIGIGKSFWNSYIKNQNKPKNTQMTLGKNDLQFSIILETVKTQKQKLIQKYNQSNQLYKAQKCFSQFVDMSTENDTLLKLCAKHTSGKQYCKIFTDFIQINILDHYKYNIKRFQEIQKMLLYRIQIWQSLQEAKLQKHAEKKDKLLRRLQMFERNFLGDWENVFVEIQKNSKTIHQNFIKQWKTFKKSMRKIWKQLKKI